MKIVTQAYRMCFNRVCVMFRQQEQNINYYGVNEKLMSLRV